MDVFWTTWTDKVDWQEMWEELESLEGETKSKIWYIMDLLANTLYHPNGITRPHVYKWYFNTSTEYWKTQEKLFWELLQDWFKREFFQIVFPWQTAWIVKKLDSNSGFDEAHIRFYKDGGIDIELEQWRFSWTHWRWRRELWHEYLIELLENLNLSDGDRHYIENHLLKDKQMHKLCELTTENDYFMKRIFFTCLFLWEYGVGSIIFFLILYYLVNNWW